MERTRLALLSAEIGLTLNGTGDLGAMFQQCAGSLASNLDVELACFWMLSDRGDVLELQAAAGEVGDALDEAYRQLPAANCEIGSIASSRAPHFTDDIANDSTFRRQAWAARERLTSFAGYPLIVDERLVGVMAMFARQPLSAAKLDSLQGVANQVAVGTERKRGEQRLQVTHYTIGDLERRVEARTKELTEINRQLAAKNEDNAMFVHSVSHDLRSPLVNLQGFSHELKRACDELRTLLATSDLTSARERATALLDGEIGRSIGFIQTGVIRLSRIITAMSGLSRIGRVEYHWQEVDLGRIVAQIYDSLHATTTAHGITMTTAELPKVWGDATALEQVFANLIDNAIKYRDPGRPAVISTGYDPIQSAALGANVYFVKDNGFGIPESLQQKAFQAFQRIHPTAAAGEGIGLTIARRIVDRHDGKIWLESAKDSGSTFFVALPGAKPDAQAGVGKVMQ
jgi:signal transduction histidine kinase